MEVVGAGENVHVIGGIHRHAGLALRSQFIGYIDIWSQRAGGYDVVLVVRHGDWASYRYRVAPRSPRPEGRADEQEPGRRYGPPPYHSSCHHVHLFNLPRI